MKRSLMKRVTAAVGVAAISIMGALALSLPAQAADVNINPDTTGSITVHKFEQPTTNGDAGDGSEQTTLPAGLVPIAGAGFTVTPISGLDLTTPEGWEAVRLAVQGFNGDPATLPAGLTLGAASSEVLTDAAGEAVFSSLPLGLYLVTETTLPTDVLTPIAPFLVTMPMGKADGSGWNYNVHVYPKNSVSGEPTKTVDPDRSYTINDEVEWTITVPIPAFGSASELTRIYVKDLLDDRLALVDPDGVSVQWAPNGGAAEAVPVPGNATVTVTGQLIEVDFTPAGLAAIQASGRGEVIVKIKTLVTGEGVITNTAFGNINDSGFTSNDGEDPPTVTFVPVEITKVDSADDTIKLEGAVFELYAEETGGTPIAVYMDGNTGEQNATQFTTDEDGMIRLYSLRAGVTYWLQEVTAPEGYLPAEGRIRIPAGTGVLTATPTGVNGGVETYTQTITNEKAGGWDWALPLTGGAGLAWFGIGGGALVLLAAGTMIASRKRKQAEATSSL